MPATNTQRFIDIWHEAVAKRDLQLIEPCIREDIVLISPALFKAKVGKPVVMGILRDVVASIENYNVVKIWTDGLEILIEFDGNVAGKMIQGIDRVTLDESGQMKELKVFIRPFSGLKALSTSVVKLQMARAEQKMNWPQKLIARTQFFVKSRLRN